MKSVTQMHNGFILRHLTTW